MLLDTNLWVDTCKRVCYTLRNSQWAMQVSRKNCKWINAHAFLVGEQLHRVGVLFKLRGSGMPSQESLAEIEDNHRYTVIYYLRAQALSGVGFTGTTFTHQQQMRVSGAGFRRRQPK